MSDELQRFLAAAAVKPVELPVRQLLALWGAKSRSFETVARITADLSRANLQCQPSVNDAGANATVWIIPLVSLRSGRGRKLYSSPYSDVDVHDQPPPGRICHSTSAARP